MQHAWFASLSSATPAQRPVRRFGRRFGWRRGTNSELSPRTHHSISGNGRASTSGFFYLIPSLRVQTLRQEDHGSST
jgi:hypothetical protein